MKTRNRAVDLNTAQARLEDYRQRAEDMGAEEVLYRMERRLEGVLEPLVRNLAYELHGHPEVAPEVLMERAAVNRQRAEEASRRAGAFFDGLRQPARAASGPPMFGWRYFLAAALAAAIIGLCLPAPGWRGCAVLALSAALAVLTLPLVPGAVRSSLLGGRAFVACLRDLFEAASASRECRRLQSRGWAAADHRARIDEWVAIQMNHLAAAYEYHKGLAAAATLAH
jgi:hypothetical protein